MGGVVVCGGSVIGLATAMLLARAGHGVTVLERDDSETPESTEAAFFNWDRTGVAQFRQFHAYTSFARRVLAERLPDVLTAVRDAGGVEGSLMQDVAAVLPEYSPQPGDEELQLLRARRTTLELVVRQCALAEPAITWRPATRVAGLSMSGGGVVDGVFLESGETLAADFVVDAMGRRSRLAQWLPGQVHDEAADTGIVYFTRWYRLRNPDPADFGPAFDLEFTRCRFGVVDDGYATLAFMAAADDEPLRLLGKDHVFQAFAEALPPLRGWVDADAAEPVSKVLFMGGLQNSWRTMNVPGVAPVGDALMCTNPFFGRGVSLGLGSAVALVDAMAASDGSPAAVSAAYAERVQEQLRPWFEDSARYDELRTKWLRAARGESLSAEEEAAASSDEARFHRSVPPAMVKDQDVARGFIRWLQCMAPPSEFSGNESMRERVFELVPEVRRRPGLPSRDDVVKLLADADTAAAPPT